MKAIAVVPGQVGSVHLRDVAEPRTEDVPAGRAGARPRGRARRYRPGDQRGRVRRVAVEAVGPAVTELRPGDYVMVRRPGTSRYDTIGLQDFTTDGTYCERGINAAPRLRVRVVRRCRRLPGQGARAPGRRCGPPGAGERRREANHRGPGDPATAARVAAAARGHPRGGAAGHGGDHGTAGPRP
jgi:hypothetical protein